MEEKKSGIFRKLETDAAGILLPFKTKKHKYNIIRPGEPMGISRWTEHMKMSAVSGIGKTFPAIADAFKEIELLAAQSRPYEELKVDIILLANSNRRGIIEWSKVKYDYGLIHSTLFIIREGDEGKDWTIDLAVEYIDDFKEDLIEETGLLFFWAKTVNGLREQAQKLKEEAARQTGALSVASGGTMEEVMS